MSGGPILAEDPPPGLLAEAETPPAHPAPVAAQPLVPLARPVQPAAKPPVPAPVALTGPAATVPATLLAALAQNPEAFSFFQALRRIEAAASATPKLGETASPAEDAVRLGQEPALTFSPRPLASFTPVPEGEDGSGAQAGTPLLLTYFFGLFGPNGALPLHLTEKAFSRQHNHGDPGLARFADLFHHRMASLFYRAWAESEPAASFDRPAEDRFGTHLGALAGFGMTALRDRDALPDLAKLHFAGRFGSHTRNPDGLRAIVGSFFEAPVEVEEFLPRWITLPRASLCRLGQSPATGTLGQTATAGRRLKVYGHEFRLRLGPLNLSQYERLLPGAPGLARMVALVRNYVGDELGWEVNLVLHEDEVPSVRLGQAGRLGWTGWLGRRPRGTHADDLHLHPVGGASAERG